MQLAICWKLRVSRATHRAVRLDVYDSDNVSSADNQQGSPLAVRAMTPQRPHAGHLYGGEDMVRALRRRKEVDSRPPARPQPGEGHQVTDLSEIPCRVIELPVPGVISAVNNRLITGKPSSYATPQGRRDAKG